MFGGGFNIGEAGAEKNPSLPGSLSALVVIAIAYRACFHVGTLTARAGDSVLWHIFMYATVCGGGWGIAYYTGRWIERHMTHVTTLTIMATALIVAVIKAAEFVILWIWGGLEYALKWLALAVNDPLEWLFPILYLS